MKSVLLLLLLLALTACGVRPSGTIPGGPAPREEIAPGTALFLLDGTTLTRVIRPAGTTPPLELLAAGPTSEELAEGLTTEIPPSAAPITMAMSADGVTVRISSALKDLSSLAQAQLVCTAIPGQRRTVILTDPTEKLPPQRCPFRG